MYLTKRSASRGQEPDERVYPNISFLKDKRYGYLIIDDYTYYCCSIFLKAKKLIKRQGDDFTHQSEDCWCHI
jgi:hypothetical protein